MLKKTSLIIISDNKIIKKKLNLLIKEKIAKNINSLAKSLNSL